MALPVPCRIDPAPFLTSRVVARVPFGDGVDFACWKDERSFPRRPRPGRQSRNFEFLAREIRSRNTPDQALAGESRVPTKSTIEHRLRQPEKKPTGKSTTQNSQEARDGRQRILVVCEVPLIIPAQRQAESLEIWNSAQQGFQMRVELGLLFKIDIFVPLAALTDPVDSAMFENQFAG